MDDQIIVQSVELMEGTMVAFTWADASEVEAEGFGEIHKSWVDLELLPEWVSHHLHSALQDLVNEFHVWKRDAPDTIEP